MGVGHGGQLSGGSRWGGGWWVVQMMKVLHEYVRSRVHPSQGEGEKVGRVTGPVGRMGVQ